ncbi:hypothetical protein ONS95_010109 [Cadophora gregata]|uniref:uncharacterized protein n=1 Tax=Cadophora gregata TaxID=51156 RepID=UPI0026DBC527|nr:uncharacterized protein ONS95_010109 [Cadophora gregata]KAK0121827.1 hypothetical protein ONS95_010109 [Cadophora gregata]KAK0127307.1 hypothetical protein ONS96_006856 [Cadophora gregata f. sp. sojae]
MLYSILLTVAGLSSVLAVPAPQVSPGTLGLGEQCSGSSECANGASCYATNSGLITRCGNFQASCSSNSQCAYNTCVDGLCNGFLASTTTTSSSQSTGTSTTVYLPLGADCNPNSTPCANGASCYATNSMLQPRCGNFQATCSNDSQCAFNTCRNGFCNGFIASTTATDSQYTSTASRTQPTSTSTTVYLPLGANCSPNSTPCANGAQCYATNSMLQPRCGNFQSACTSNAQCAFNTCNQGLCNGFLANSSSSPVSTAPTTSTSEASSSKASSTEASSTIQSTAVVTMTPVVTESSLVIVTPSATAGSSSASTTTSSAPAQLNTNAAAESKSRHLGLVIAGAAAVFAFA